MRWQKVFIFIFVMYVVYEQKEIGCNGLHLRPQITSLPLTKTKAENKNVEERSRLNIKNC